MTNRTVWVSLLAVAGFAVGGCTKQAASGPMVFPPTQVIAVEARKQTVTETLSLVGTLAADEMVEIKSEIDGLVESISFEEGKPVKKWQLLIQLDDTKLATSLAEAEANFNLSKANFERTQQIFRDKLISQQEYDQSASTYEANRATLERKRRELKDTRIYASFDGVMSSRNFSPGQVIAKNTTMSWLVKLDPVKVEVNVPERFLSQLHAGQTLELSVAAFPGRKFNGKVFFVAPSVDSVTRTALVKAEIPNPEFELKPGMFANLDLTLKIKDDAVVIPETALMLSGDKATVFTVDKTQTAQIRPVKIGVRMAGVAEIVSGLQAGELVIVEGIQKARPGGPVKVAPPEVPAATSPKEASAANSK